MNVPILRAFIVAVVSSLVVCVLCLFALRSDSAPVGFREFMRGVRHGEEMDQFLDYTHRHVKFKERVLQEVIDQRCSLREALERLQEMDREWFQKMEREWPDFSRESAKNCRQERADPDWYYRWIIMKIPKHLLFDRPEEAAAVLRRLEKEYQQFQAGRQTPGNASMRR